MPSRFQSKTNLTFQFFPSVSFCYNRLSETIDNIRLPKNITQKSKILQHLIVIAILIISSCCVRSYSGIYSFVAFGLIYIVAQIIPHSHQHTKAPATNTLTHYRLYNRKEKWLLI